MTNERSTSEKPEVIVNYSPALHELRFSSQQGEAYPPAPLMAKLPAPEEGAISTPVMLENLLRFQQLTGGIGVISAREAADQLHPDEEEPTLIRTVMSHANAIVQYVPEEIFTYYRSDQGETMLACGSFAVATSLQPATAEDQLAAEERRQQAREHRRRNGSRSPLKDQQRREKLAIAKEKTEALEADKTKLTEFDHATFRIKGNDFYLDFQKPIDLLITRFVSALNKAPADETSPVHRSFDIAKFNDFVWNTMTIAERKLFARTEAYVFGGSSPISRSMKNIRIMLSYSNDYRRALIKSRENEPFTFPRADIETHVHRSPRTEAGYSEKLVLDKARLEVPRRYRDHIIEEETAAPTEDDLAWAQAWVARRRGFLSHQEAIDAFDKLMSREGKAALRLTLGANAEDAYEALISRSHVAIRSSLGSDAYWDAWRERVVAGTKPTTGARHTAEQTGGRLRGDRTTSHRHLKNMLPRHP